MFGGTKCSEGKLGFLGFGSWPLPQNMTKKEVTSSINFILFYSRRVSIISIFVSALSKLDLNRKKD